MGYIVCIANLLSYISTNIIYIGQNLTTVLQKLNGIFWEHSVEYVAIVLQKTCSK